MGKEVIDLDVYVPEAATVKIQGKEYEIPVPAMKPRMQFIKKLNEISQIATGADVQDSDVNEKLFNAMIDVCQMAIPGIKREVLEGCYEEQIQKIIEVATQQYGTDKEDDDSKK